MSGGRSMQRGRVDLHLHTTASDGSWSPTELVAAATEAGLTLLAITDHDTTDGIDEAMAAGRAQGVLVAPGVELSVDTEEYDIHLLGYFVREDDAEFQAALQDLRDKRAVRNAAILARLNELGRPLDPARVQQISGSRSVGRPHIARAMVERGYVAGPGEAFGRYLARGRPAFVPRIHLSLEEGCAIIRRAGGLSVLAHPAKIGSWPLVEQLLTRGVDGLEAYHSDHSAASTQRLLYLARQRGLLVTGGTDSHGPSTERPTQVGEVAMPGWVETRFLERAPEWWRSQAPR